MKRGRLDLAIVGAVIGMAVAVAVRIVLGTPSRVPDPNELVLLLISLAALCVVGLARHRDPPLAWIACVTAASFAYLDLVAAIRLGQATIEPSTVGWLLGLTGMVAIGAVAIAGGYATERARRIGPWVTAIVWLGLGAVVLAAWVVLPATMTAGLGDDGDPKNAVRPLTWTTIVVVLVLTTLGVLGDLRPAFRRTQLRLDLERADGPIRRGRRTAVLLDELAPGRHRADRAAADERTRIAADLHAHVVPPVRRALEAAEQGGSPDELVATLRTVLADVDAMTAERHSVTLEVLGLVAALEQLAERVEDRSDVRVSIDVASGTDVRPPPAVEAAALRVAQLALDNVMRHAPGAAVRIEVAVAADAVRLAVTDDGPGLTEQREAQAAAAGRRGLADMHRVADACGGRLTIGREHHAGTSIAFTWPQAGPASAAQSVVSRKPQEGTSPISS